MFEKKEVVVDGQTYEHSFLKKRKRERERKTKIFEVLKAISI
jgi:hypothetical protein